MTLKRQLCGRGEECEQEVVLTTGGKVSIMFSQGPGVRRIAETMLKAACWNVVLGSHLMVPTHSRGSAGFERRIGKSRISLGLKGW